MRNTRKIIAAAVALLAVSSCVTQKAAVESTPVQQQQALNADFQKDIKALYTAAFSHQDGYNWLHYICTEFGPRPSGSEAYNNAANWTAEYLKDLGADTVWLQPVEVPNWHRGKEYSTMIYGDTEVSLPTTALGGSEPTPTEGIRAEVVEVSSFAELEELGEENIKGKIVFYNTYMKPGLISTFNAYGGAVKYRWAGAAEAAKYGAVATVLRSVTLLRDDLPHTGSMSYGDSEVKIPCAAISYLAADKLAAALEENSTVELDLFLDCGIHGTAINHNIIADFYGSTKPEEVMLVGGHFDSWDLGQGAQDDGAGCAHAVQVPALFKRIGYENKRTVRVVLWANEEFGLGGAQVYADWCRETGFHHWVAMESDAGGDVPRGFGIGGSDAQVAMVQEYSRYLKPYGLHSLTPGGGGPDLTPLRGHDTFFIGFRPESQRYFDYHHSARDRIDAIHPRSLEMGAASLAAMYYLLDHES